MLHLQVTSHHICVRLCLGVHFSKVELHEQDPTIQTLYHKILKNSSLIYDN